MYSYKGDVITLQEYFINGEKYKTSFQRLDRNNSRKLMTFSDAGNTNVYIETNESKVAVLNSESISKIQIWNGLETTNLKDFILISLLSRITTENCNGKECYKIDTSYSQDILYSENKEATFYIDKETGLLVRILNGTEISESRDTVNTLTDYYYEFDNVTEQDLTEPDITQYKIQEN